MGTRSDTLAVRSGREGSRRLGPGWGAAWWGAVTGRPVAAGGGDHGGPWIQAWCQGASQARSPWQPREEGSGGTGSGGRVTSRPVRGQLGRSGPGTEWRQQGLSKDRVLVWAHSQAMGATVPAEGRGMSHEVGPEPKQADHPCEASQAGSASLAAPSQGPSLQWRCWWGPSHPKKPAVTISQTGTPRPRAAW